MPNASTEIDPPHVTPVEPNIDGEQIVLPSPGEDSSSDFRHYAVLISVGVFVTTFAAVQNFAKLPLQHIIKSQLHLNPKQMAVFFMIAGLAWYFKPLAGILSDNVRLFGTRRRHYLIISSSLAALFWLLTAIVPQQYWPLLLIAVGVNAMVVIGSTVIGGLLVDESRKYSAAGRLSSIRLAVMNGASLIAGPVGGFLAGKAFGLTSAVGAFLMLALAFCSYKLMHEEAYHLTSRETGVQTWQQFKLLFRSGTLWSAVGLTFLFYVAPGFQSLLYYYQSNVLKFSDQQIGWLATISGVCAVFGALSYGLICRRFNLRVLLFFGIAMNAAAILLYLGYHSQTAAYFVEGSTGFFSTLGIIPLYDLSARVTPKGSEALGYSLLMGIGNFAISLSDVVGTRLADHFHLQFMQMVWINAGTTAMVLVFIPFLPRAVMTRKEGESAG
jgi:predicted MFS family arabinose efflux permease